MTPFSYLQDHARPSKPAQITDACAVADVLGPDVRRHLIDRYVTLELKEYRRIFRATDEAGYLDNISRRYAWFRRILGIHETEVGRVFPSEWKVGWVLFTKFVAITRYVTLWHTRLTETFTFSEMTFLRCFLKQALP